MIRAARGPSSNEAAAAKSRTGLLMLGQPFESENPATQANITSNHLAHV